MFLADMAKPAVEAEAKAVRKAQADDPIALSYVRSYHVIRTGVGVLGAALPFVLVLGRAALDGWWSLLGSLSAYYHTGMRDIFVGTLVVVGILLLTYKIADRKIDNGLSSFAGVFAIGVALFPTAIPAGLRPIVTPTPIQEWLSEDRSQLIHFLCAGLFILCLMLLCVFFAYGELEPETEVFDGRRGVVPPKAWFSIHLAMAFLILAAAVFIIVTQLWGILDTYSVLIGEAVAIWAFGVSWFLKGFDLKVLRPRGPETGRSMRAA
jgi:hypothetical protein